MWSIHDQNFGHQRPLNGRSGWRGPILLGAVAFLAAACGSGSQVTPGTTSSSGSSATSGSASSPGTTGPSGTTSQATSVLVGLDRSGGIAGVHDVVEVRSDGTWTATRSGGGRTVGRLEPEQVTALRQLIGGAWRSGASPSPTNPCPDGFVYRLTAGGRAAATTTTNDCTLGSQPILQRLITTVLAGTGL